MERSTVALFLFAVAILFFSALGTLPLMEPDEGRYAEIPREMLASGDLVTPRLNGVVYLEKPPLFYWGNALAMSVLGRNETGARAFTAAVSFAGVLLAYWMGATLHDRRTGLYAAAVLSTSLFHYIVGRINTLDMTLAVPLSAAIFLPYLYVTGRKRSRVWLWLGYGAAGLAFLAKGLAGVVFPPAILVLWALVARRGRDIPRFVSGWGILLFLGVALPWVVLVQRENPDFLWFFFVREHFLRYSTEMHGRQEPFWYFLPIVPAGIMPWLAFLPQALRAARERAAGYLPREDVLFLAVWAGFIVLFFSASGSKLATYMAPVFPPLAVLLGRGIAAWAEGAQRPGPLFLPAAVALLLAAGVAVAPLFAKGAIPWTEWAGLAAAPVFFLLAWCVAAFFAPRLGAERTVFLSFLALALFLMSMNRPAVLLVGEGRSGKGMARVLAAEVRPGDVVAQYGTYVQSIPFYTGIRTLVVGDPGELRFGAARLPAPEREARFPDEASFLRLWNSDRRVFCVFSRHADPVIRAKFPGHRLLYRSRRGILIVNR